MDSFAYHVDPLLGGNSREECQGSCVEAVTWLFFFARRLARGGLSVGCGPEVAGCRGYRVKQSGRSSAASCGLHPFKVAGVSISGWYPSAKAPSGRQPFTSQLEFTLGLYLELHPLVVSYQRGDRSLDFARTHRLERPLGAPFAMAYAFEDQSHDCLPDYVGTLVGLAARSSDTGWCARSAASCRYRPPHGSYRQGAPSWRRSQGCSA